MNTDGLLLRPSSYANYELWVDEIRLSNALTVEHNSLGVGAVGHITCARTFAPGAGGNGATGLVDTFYFYDHIGNVQGASEASGALASTCAQDAWGNVLASTTTGAWASSPSSRHLTTKEYDPDSSLYYFWQRHYLPGAGFFASRTTRPHYYEHPFTYCGNQPILMTDPRGLDYHPPQFPGDIGWSDDYPEPGFAIPNIKNASNNSWNFPLSLCLKPWKIDRWSISEASRRGKSDKWMHCMGACIIESCTGGAFVGGMGMTAQYSWELWQMAFPDATQKRRGMVSNVIDANGDTIMATMGSCIGSAGKMGCGACNVIP